MKLVEFTAMLARFLKTTLVAGVLAMLGCHVGLPPHLEAWDQLTPEEQRDQLVRNAEELARYRAFQVDEKRFTSDCSGYVGAVLYRNGLDAFGNATEFEIQGNGVRILREFVGKYGVLFNDTPRPGDLVFFSNTYDRNRDGKLNDAFTHVGVVEQVQSDDTIVFMNYVRGRVRRYAMNVKLPGRHSDADGKIVNSYLRKRGRRDPKNISYLAGGLVSGFGTLVWDRSFNTSEALTSLSRSSTRRRL